MEYICISEEYFEKKLYIKNLGEMATSEGSDQRRLGGGRILAVSKDDSLRTA